MWKITHWRISQVDFECKDKGADIDVILKRESSTPGYEVIHKNHIPIAQLVWFNHSLESLRPRVYHVHWKLVFFRAKF